MYNIPKNDFTLNMRIPRSLKDELDRIARENGCTTSAMIRSMLYGAVYSFEHPETVDAVKAILNAQDS